MYYISTYVRKKELDSVKGTKMRGEGELELKNIGQKNQKELNKIFVYVFIIRTN